MKKKIKLLISYDYSNNTFLMVVCLNKNKELCLQNNFVGIYPNFLFLETFY